MRHLLVGLDGGGTKTDAVLCDGEGRVLRRAVGASSSPVSQTFTLASEHIRETLAKLLMGYEGFYAPLTGFFAGISGGGVGKNAQHFTSFFRELLPNTAHLRSGSDSINALSSGIGPGDGIVAIAGTGSSVFVRLDDTMHQVGGWGYLLGDECSGYELGHFALMGALRAYDGRGPATLLSKLCAQRLNGSVAEQIQRIYE
ncbi:MAG: BadF/BadG/BcrA/BcrD ATPase family protein, partial [Clostridia bacterium]